MSEIKQYIDQFGSLGLIRFLAYPITTLITTPLQLLRSLAASTKLFGQSADRFPHFDLFSSLNYYFYASRAWNLKQYGRSGNSPYLGLGDYSLARCFNYSLFSLYAYWWGGALVVLLSMIGWWAMHLLWHFDDSFFYIAWVVPLCSTLFFINTFRYQNYNAVGWLFFPLGVYGTVTGDVELAALGWLLVSFGSFTGVVLGGILSFVYGIYAEDWLLTFSAVPAAIKLLLHFYPFFTGGASKEILGKVLKAIGASDNVKYRRKKTKALSVSKLYFLLLYTQFVVVFFLVTDHWPILVITAIGIYVVNAMKFRFADLQSIYMLMLSVMVPHAIMAQDWWILASLWVAISPLPLLIGYDHRKDVLDVVPASEPFDIMPLKEKIGEFLNQVQSGDRVYMAYKDPQGQYEKVFNGYRHLIELPIYMGMQKDIRLFPGWWSVFELNYEGAKELWGTKPEEVRSLMQEWDCGYVIVYSNAEHPHEPSLWENEGFALQAELDWNTFDSIIEQYKKPDLSGLKWHLYKLKAG